MEFEPVHLIFFSAVILIIALIYKFTPNNVKVDGNQEGQKKDSVSMVSKKSDNGSKSSNFDSIEKKLDKLYDVMNHIRYIGLGIGGMFAITFIIPNCTGG